MKAATAEKTANTGVLNTWREKRLNSYTAQITTGDKFTIDLQQPCRNCKKSWPDTTMSLSHNIDLKPPKTQTRLQIISGTSMTAYGRRNYSGQEVTH